MVAGALAIFGFIIGMIWFWVWFISCLFGSKQDDRCYREYGEYYDQSYHF